MRWTRNYTDDDENSYTGSAESLLEDWSLLVAAARRDWQPTVRDDLKIAARQAGFLKDVLPPAISVSGRTVTITRTGGSGSLYYNWKPVSQSVEDPASLESSPSPTAFPTRPPFTIAEPTSQAEIDARVYGLDLDGLGAWSAVTIRHFTYP